MSSVRREGQRADENAIRKDREEDHIKAPVEGMKRDGKNLVEKLTEAE